MASKFLGLSAKEALLLPVGLVLDMVEVEIRRRSPEMKKGPGRKPWPGMRLVTEIFFLLRSICPT